jgi:hypothetical protein
VAQGGLRSAGLSQRGSSPLLPLIDPCQQNVRYAMTVTSFYDPLLLFLGIPLISELGASVRILRFSTRCIVCIPSAGRVAILDICYHRYRRPTYFLQDER